MNIKIWEEFKADEKKLRDGFKQLTEEREKEHAPECKPLSEENKKAIGTVLIILGIIALIIF